MKSEKCKLGRKRGKGLCPRCKKRKRKNWSTTKYKCNYCVKCLSKVQRYYQQKNNGCINPPSTKEWSSIIKSYRKICPCCKRENKGRWNAHHNHRTGKFVGIVCNRCNLAFAYAGDSAKIMKKIYSWFKKNHIDDIEPNAKQSENLKKAR